ncbi:MAG: penicillin binding protein PBP4B [Clostridia bacterium]|nr:penicillin binding protein PBP4B [Clostridia bacterium]
MRFLPALLLIFLLICGMAVASAEGNNIESIPSLPNAGWQKTAVFPDAWGYTDDTLAMNSMLSYLSYHGQGSLCLEIAPGVESFSLYVNSHRIDTGEMTPGTYRLDCTEYAVDGRNTVQVTNIRPADLKGAVSVYVPYPVVLDGSLDESGIRPEALRLVTDLIQSDIDSGFPSAQLAIVRHGRLVYSNAWGKLSRYHPDGTENTDSPDATTDTLYDLASLTKVMSVNYALQKLVTEGRLDVDTKIVDILGTAFADDTWEIHYANTEFPGLDTMKAWKADLTVRDLLVHQAGFPADVHYYSEVFDMEALSERKIGHNILFAGSDGSDQTRQNTLEAIFKTPLMYPPRTKILYSDLDYMILGFIVEAVSGQRLDQYMQENFFEPMQLTRIAFNPLQSGFTAADCAATELNGNTRDHLISFPGVREYTLQGEVHDEKSWYSMGGVSGHAGLFASASDLARLGMVMFSGGYGENRFFSRTVIDTFAAPKSATTGQYGLGWERNGDDQRPWYYGTQSVSCVVGHQGWTGTLIMIDPDRDMVIVYLTNKVNSPVTSPDRTNRFNGNYFTASTLGFVPQLLSIGLDTDNDVTDQLTDLLTDMANESAKLVKSQDANHPSVLNVRSKLAVLREWAKDQPTLLALADEIEKSLP